jgi:hypothetical protein
MEKKVFLFLSLSFSVNEKNGERETFEWKEFLIIFKRGE